MSFLLTIGLLTAVFAGVDVAGYLKLQETRDELQHLREDVNQASRIAQEESAAAAAAKKQAEEAARQAATSAQGRQLAESTREQAEEATRKAQEQTRQATDKMTAMVQERQAELNRMQEALNRIAETKRTANGMVITLPNSIFRFEFDRADLSARNRELLSRIAGILLVSKGFGLSVFGYTDDVGSPDYNQQLSLKRAKVVGDYLIQSGLDPAIINTKGYGKSSPIAPGTSDDSRARNRRVEIALTDSSIRFDEAEQ